MINLGSLFGLCLLSTQEIPTFADGRLGKRGGGHYGCPGPDTSKGGTTGGGEPVPGRNFVTSRYFCKDCKSVGL